MDIFETVARKKMRFATAKGELNSEQIWDLSLNELDVAARMVNSELKGVTEESFIQVKPDPRATEIQLQLDVLKRVIEVKLQEKGDRDNAAKKRERREKLIKALQSKEDDSLANMSEAKLRKELESLD